MIARGVPAEAIAGLLSCVCPAWFREAPNSLHTDAERVAAFKSIRAGD